MKRRYIALFFLVLLIVPVLALPASAALSIDDDLEIIDLDDFLTESKTENGNFTNTFSFPSALGSGKALFWDGRGDNGYSIVSSSNYSFTASGGELQYNGSYYDSYRFTYPIIFSDSSSGMSYIKNYGGSQVIDVSKYAGSVFSFSFDFSMTWNNYSLISSPGVSVYSCIQFYDSSGAILKPDLTSWNTKDNEVNTGSAWYWSRFYRTGGQGAATFYNECVIPDNACYMTIEASITGGLYDGAVVSYSISTPKLVLSSPLPAVTPSYSINWDPDAVFDCSSGGYIAPLTVTVDELDYGTYSYQWYKGQIGTPTASNPYGYGTAISSATSPSYTPPTSAEGIAYYYCVVKHETENVATSLCYAITPEFCINVYVVPPDEPTVSSTNSSSITSVIGSPTLIDLGVNSVVKDGGMLTYQWYFSLDKETWYPLQDATDPTIQPQIDEAGTYYYRCDVTNTTSTGSVTVSSEVTKVTVRAPTIDDVTTSWGSASVLEVNQGDITSLYINVPSGLYDSYTLQWYVLFSSFSSTAIEGETSMGFQIPTDELGTFQYMVLLTGQDGTNLVRTQFKAPRILVMEEGSVVTSVDEATGISWNWDDNPVRIKQGSTKILLVSIPTSLSGWSVQWYSGPEIGPPAPISGATDCFYEVPTDVLGETYYTCVVTLEDGTTVSPTAQVIVVEADNYDSTTGGTGSGTGSSRPTGIDTSGWYKTSTKNNLDLVEWAMQAYENGWGYVLGTYGQILTEDLLEYKIGQYPDISQHEEFIRNYWLNGRVADCVGLIKGYCWFTPSDGTIGYAINDTPDYSADQMYEWCEETGTIDTLPEIPGLLLWKSGHVGIYIGGGYVIEARGTKAGVIKSYIGDLAWTNWAKIPSIDYLETGAAADDNSLSGIWQTIKNLPKAILDGIVGLFVPSQESMEEYAAKWDQLLAQRFGAVWASVGLVSELVDISYSETTTEITIPSVTVDLAGTPWTFGGWTVQVVADESFLPLFDFSKLAVNLVATLAFANGLKKRLYEILGINFASDAQALNLYKSGKNRNSEGGS